MSALKCVKNRIIVAVNLEEKNSHTFSDGTKIKIERNYDNFDRKYVAPVQGIVIDSEYIPKGAKVLFHHNGCHPTNQIFNYKNLSGNETSSDIKHFSIADEHCYLWSMKDDEWNPAKGFATGLRVFKPYKGFLHGIEPTQISNVMYITSGDLKGKVCHTLKAADYTVIFQNSKGRESRILRCRHWDDEENDREEIVAIDAGLTKKVDLGEYHVGLTKSDAKPINEIVYGI